MHQCMFIMWDQVIGYLKGGTPVHYGNLINNTQLHDCSLLSHDSPINIANEVHKLLKIFDSDGLSIYLIFSEYESTDVGLVDG